MAEEPKSRARVDPTTGGFGGLWFLGFLGSFVYFLHFRSGSFWRVLLAIWKSIFWPAYFVNYLLAFMNL